MNMFRKALDWVDDIPGNRYKLKGWALAAVLSAAVMVTFGPSAPIVGAIAAVVFGICGAIFVRIV